MAHKNGTPLVQFTNGNPRANAAMEKLAMAQEDAFKRAAKLPEDIADRSVEISRKVTFMYSKGVNSEAEMKELLAAKALGLMQSLTYPERSDFLRGASGRIITILKMENVADIFIGRIENSQEREGRQIELLASLSRYDKLANEYFDMLRYVCLLDVTDKDAAEYHEMYAKPIISGEIPRPVMYVRLWDLAIDPEKKIEFIGRGGPVYNDRQLMELSRTMISVHYPLSDAIGLGTTQAIDIRRNATRMLEGLLRAKVENGTHTQADIENLELYERCRDYYYFIEQPAKKFQSEFIHSGKLKEIVDLLGKRFGLEIALASHTSNEEDVSRIKGPSGIYLKIKNYRKRAEKARREGDVKRIKKYEGYDINRVPDIVGATMVVKGTLEDATEVADRLVWHLRQQLKATEFEVDAVPRDTGYTVPHVTCKAKVDGEEVPFEVQVRPAETHEEAKTGGLSHATKLSGFITGELVEKLKATFSEMETAHDTLRLFRASLPRADSKQKAFMVSVFEGPKREGEIPDSKKVIAYKGECVGGVVALSVGLSKPVEVTNGEDRGLDLFGECPGGIVIRKKKGAGINKETCKMLMDGKVITPEALRIFAEYYKIAPSKKWYKRS